MQRFFKIAAFVALGFAAAPGYANTLTISQTQTFEADILGDWASADFAGFDNSMGTLVGVNAVVTLTSPVVETFYNGGSVASAATIHDTESWIVNIPGSLGGPLWSPDNPDGTGQNWLADQSSLPTVTTASVAANTLSANYSVTGSQTDTLSSIADDDLTPFETAFSVTGSDTRAISATPSPRVAGTATVSGPADFTVTFNYSYIPTSTDATNVPEPSAILLLSSGVAVLGTLRRSRR